MSIVKKNVVVVGGGTGTHTVLSGLKAYTKSIKLQAIVSMADSGGSTGRLRDEFGHLPAGDVRNALTALAADGDGQDTLLRQLFMYRFSRGDGLLGHNFGNLFLTALTDILGSEEQAIAAASRILRVAGQVIPVTTQAAHLKATYQDGTVVVGEHAIDEPVPDWSQSEITELALTPSVTINQAAALALRQADLIVLGPGDLYTSVIANLVVTGFAEAVADSSAKLVYVCNLMTKTGQTIGLNAAEHVAEITRYLGRAPDFALVHTGAYPTDLLEAYARVGNHPVVNNCTGDTCVIVANQFASDIIARLQRGDVLQRSLIRHDPARLAATLMEILNSKT